MDWKCSYALDLSCPNRKRLEVSKNVKYINVTSRASKLQVFKVRPGRDLNRGHPCESKSLAYYCVSLPGIFHLLLCCQFLQVIFVNVAALNSKYCCCNQQILLSIWLQSYYNCQMYASGSCQKYSFTDVLKMVYISLWYLATRIQKYSWSTDDNGTQQKAENLLLKHLQCTLPDA